MPRYAVMVYQPQPDQKAPQVEPQWDSPEFQKVAQAWEAFRVGATTAGVMTFNEGLGSAASATTVRVRDGKTLTTDGPFAETREQIGGVFIFECKDLDEAISWAAKIPSAQDGAIELRPLWQQ